MNNFRTIRIKPWREISILMIILMEVSWITPWFRSLTPETYAVDSSRVLIFFASIFLLSHFFVRMLDYLYIKKSIKQGLIIIFLFLCCLIGSKVLLYYHETTSLQELFSRPIRGFTDIATIIPVEFLVIVAVMIGIWRGISLAQQPIGPSTVKSHFWVGIVMFIAFVFLITLATNENPGEFFYLFLLSGLVGVSAARMSVVGMIRGGIENRFNRSWFLGILFAAVVVVGLSLLLGWLLSDKFGWIGGIFAGIIGSIILVFWMIINPVISFFISIFNKLLGPSQLLKDLGDSFQSLNNLMLGFGEKISQMVSESGIMKLISQLAPTIKTIILLSVIVVIIVGIVLWITVSLWRDRIRRKIGNEEKSKIPGGNILNSLLSMLKQGWEKTVNSLGQLIDVNRQRRIRAAARIRQIYADLLDLCEVLGQPRPKSITPLEFLPIMDQLFPDHQVETSMITNAYLNVRYGLLPEDKDHIAIIENAWDKLQSIGREKQKKK